MCNYSWPPVRKFAHNCTPHATLVSGPPMAIPRGDYSDCYAALGVSPDGRFGDAAARSTGVYRNGTRNVGATPPAKKSEERSKRITLPTRPREKRRDHGVLRASGPRRAVDSQYRTECRPCPLRASSRDRTSKGQRTTFGTAKRRFGRRRGAAIAVFSRLRPVPSRIRYDDVWRPTMPRTASDADAATKAQALAEFS